MYFTNVFFCMSSICTCMYVCMYVSMYVCMYVNMYVHMYVCIYIWMYTHTYICMYDFVLHVVIDNWSSFFSPDLLSQYQLI